MFLFTQAIFLRLFLPKLIFPSLVSTLSICGFHIFNHPKDNDNLTRELHYDRFLLFFFFLSYTEVPGPGVQSELQLLATATARATQDLSCICNVYHNSWQRWILNPWARTGVEPATSWMLIRFASAEPQWELLVLFFLRYNYCRANEVYSLLVYLGPFQNPGVLSWKYL